VRALILCLLLTAVAGADELRKDVEALAFPRNVQNPGSLTKALNYLNKELVEAGYKPRKQVYSLGTNLIAERKGSEHIVVVGAHYDTVPGCPGADDNGSGCAAVLALARRFPENPKGKTLRFVLFANEEPPNFQRDGLMGSIIYADACKQRGDKIDAMFSLETMGFYSDAKGSQKNPLGTRTSDTGNFIALVGHPESKALADEVMQLYQSPVPMEKVIAPDLVPGIGWSDHWAFWRRGYPALMVTDTALYRNPNYHRESDTPETLDYRRFGQVVDGLAKVVKTLTNR
jgi:Zn-dependent M28 family amino/carboxypeptidase